MYHCKQGDPSNGDEGTTRAILSDNGYADVLIIKKTLSAVNVPVMDLRVAVRV